MLCRQQLADRCYYRPPTQERTFSLHPRRIPVIFSKRGVEFAKFPENFTLISMSGFILDSEDLRGEPGVLLGLHPTQPIGPLGYLIARIPEEEAPILEFLGQALRSSTSR